jgi:OmpA-OmpF porin, OOP family
MRCNPWRWMWGLIPIAMLTWAANVWERPGIEADLQARSEQALERDGLGWAKIAFEGRDAILTGRASDEAEPKQALDDLRRTWGVRVTKSRTDLVERVERYKWAAALTDRTLVLSGYVPSETSRRTVVNMAKASFPKASINDDMTVARGAPPNDVWLGGVNFALKQLTGIKRGSVELSNTDLSIDGEATDGPSYKSIRSAVPGKLPKGWALGANTVTPPAINPFTWSAKYAANQLVMSGYVPSDTVKESLFAHAKKTFPKIALVDRLEVAGGAPANWADAATLSLDQLYQLKDGTAEMRGTELMLSGNAEDEDTAEAIRQSIKGASSKGFRVSDAIKAPKSQIVTANPYTTSASANDGRLKLSGYVPSEAGRASLLAATRARFPNMAIDDKLQIAAGAPSGWEQCMLAGLAGLGKLEKGEAALTSNRILVTGTTADQNAAIAVPVDLRTAASGACDADARIDVSRTNPAYFSWFATKNKDGSLLLEGDAPDTSARVELNRQAETLFPSVRIDDRMVVVSKRSETWTSVTTQALRMLSNLRAGEASLSGDDVMVRGLASSEGVASSVRRQLKDLPQGFRGRDEVRVDTAALAAEEAQRKAAEDAARQKAEREAAAKTCQNLLTDVAAQGTIQFERASDNLNRASAATINKLAKVANDCPQTRIEISGHTDSEGIPERNQPLSERRATAVAEALINAGVADRRLSAEGYGAERPIADNATAEGRAKNRRIEFAVVPE